MRRESNYEYDVYIRWVAAVNRLLTTRVNCC